MTRTVIATVLCVPLLWTGVASAARGGFDKAIEAAIPRVVKLYGLGAGTQAGYGTGIVVSDDGYILTVFSLLIDSPRLRAVTADGTRHRVEVVRRDHGRQLALLRVREEAENVDSEARAGLFPHFNLACAAGAALQSGESSVDPCDAGLLPGDWVVAAGNPFKVAVGAEPVSIVHGVYSARTRLDARRKVKEFPYHGDVLVIDAVTANPGAPGSALVNLEGELVGMIGRVVVSNLTHTQFNYAIPRDVLYEFFLEATQPAARTASDSMRDAGESQDAARRGAQDAADPGIRLTRTGYMRLPPFVERVQRGSPAARAGVRKDDLILSVNGHSVPDVKAYDKRMARVASGEPIDLVIQRGRRIVTIRVEPETTNKQLTKPW